MLKLTAIGNIGQDAEVKQVNGKSVIAFSLAHNDTYMKDGVKHSRTTWVNCEYWREGNNTKIAQYLNKGTLVYVEGSPRPQAYTDKNGQAAVDLKLVVLNIQLLSQPTQTNSIQSGGESPQYNNSGGPQNTTSSAAAPQNYNPLGDLPENEDPAF